MQPPGPVFSGSQLWPCQPSGRVSSSPCEAVPGVAGLPTPIHQVPAPSGPQPFWQQETALRVFFVFGHLALLAGSYFPEQELNPGP